MCVTREKSPMSEEDETPKYNKIGWWWWWWKS